ncbi:hypothetical protein AALO_G00237870 [Alosa alosa]|uniref:Uncharacterized protein n=1 Tax=Alosa alosa TaxID=278164 RepID=A0AAV6FVQ9_9TELE|nr:hypothetical protein AALO_G00237870 [Alosa alosa]
MNDSCPEQVKETTISRKKKMRLGRPKYVPLKYLLNLPTRRELYKTNNCGKFDPRLLQRSQNKRSRQRDVATQRPQACPDTEEVKLLPQVRHHAWNYGWVSLHIYIFSNS